LNLKEEKDKEKFLKLVEKADVILEGFRPGVMEKLGLGYERLKEIKPDLIWCSITGFGQYGPYRDLPGHDINYISLVGVLNQRGLIWRVTHPSEGEFILLVPPYKFSSFDIYCKKLPPFLNEDKKEIDKKYL